MIHACFVRLFDPVLEPPSDRLIGRWLPTDTHNGDLEIVAHAQNANVDTQTWWIKQIIANSAR